MLGYPKTRQKHAKENYRAYNRSKGGEKNCGIILQVGVAAHN
jgi:hypothetical protein